MKSIELGRHLSKIALAGTLGASVALAGCADQPQPAEYTGYKVSFSAQEMPFDPTDPNNITCYATDIAWQRDPSGKTLLVFYGGSGFANKTNPANGMPIMNGPECYFGNHVPVNTINNSAADPITKQVSGLETVPHVVTSGGKSSVGFENFIWLRENENLLPFGVVGNRRTFAIDSYKGKSVDNIPMNPDNKTY